MTHEDKDLLTILEFCQIARFSRNSFYKEIREGRLTARQYGRRVFILRVEAERWLRDMPIASAASRCGVARMGAPA